MRAEILGLPGGYEIQPAEREDNTFGPPYTMELTLRTCWKKPPRHLHLVYLYESEGVAYYGVKST